MSIGCVLAFGAIAGTIAAIGAACVLTLIVFLIRRRRTSIRWWWLVIAAALPFVLLAYAGGAFSAYALWCETVRGVDPGIGDLWLVPLPNGWRFAMIDTPEEGYLTSRSGEQIHPGITRIGVRGDYVFGQDGDTYFFIDTKSERDETLTAESDLLRKMRTIGATRDDLDAAVMFYGWRRWTIADALAAIVMAIPPSLLVLALGLRFLVLVRRR